MRHIFLVNLKLQGNLAFRKEKLRTGSKAFRQFSLVYKMPRLQNCLIGSSIKQHVIEDRNMCLFLVVSSPQEYTFHHQT